MEKPEKIHLLLVDDDRDYCKLLSTYFKNKGIIVTSSLSAKDALEKFKKDNHLEVVVSDIYMDDMDGIEFLQQIKMMDRDFPVILISGCIDIESLIMAMGITVDDYILKPFDMKDILDPIYKAVNMYRGINK